METDSGSQTRLFSFGAPRGKAGDLQGVSDCVVGSSSRLQSSGFQLGSRAAQAEVPQSGHHSSPPGYLARNGVPYGANATFTEYYDSSRKSPAETRCWCVTVEVTDPDYLTAPYWYSVHFKKQADASGWNAASVRREVDMIHHEASSSGLILLGASRQARG